MTYPPGSPPPGPQGPVGPTDPTRQVPLPRPPQGFLRPTRPDPRPGRPRERRRPGPTPAAPRPRSRHRRPGAGRHGSSVGPSSCCWWSRPWGPRPRGGSPTGRSAQEWQERSERADAALVESLAEVESTRAEVEDARQRLRDLAAEKADETDRNRILSEIVSQAPVVTDGMRRVPAGDDRPGQRDHRVVRRSGGGAGPPDPHRRGQRHLRRGPRRRQRARGIDR